MSEVQSHEAFKIPTRNSTPGKDSGFASSSYIPSNKTANSSISFENQHFAEIEIDDGKSSSYKSALIPQPTYPVLDEKRRIFKSMREIAWNNHSSNILNSKFYNMQTQHENSRVFYKQAIFMKDFEDDYTEAVPFSSYFPYYQLMTYEQLRTYFTWRTKVRSGIIESTSLSYAFVYVYELLNNIGIKDPVDGLDRLISFRQAYKIYDTAIDKYLIKWLKDYHVYYQLPKSFKEFICENKLESYYPDIARYEQELSCNFEYLSGLSKYNIRQSAFYDNTTSSLITECFEYVINRLKSIFADGGLELNNLIFQTSGKKSGWTPFKGALFYPTLKQPDKKIVLSNNELYICSHNIWYLSTVITTDSGRQLIGYILKQLEAVLRKATGYKYKLSASLNSVNSELIQMLNTKGVSLEKAVTDAVIEFYREKNKTVVSVNESVLSRIRLEAQDTQEKLIVPENEPHLPPAGVSALSNLMSVDVPVESDLPAVDTSALSGLKTIDESALSDLKSTDAPVLSDGWTSLRQALSNVEINALSAVIQGNRDIKQFADDHGIMLEVLADSINEKAFDHIGDSILELDDNMIIYDEYLENIKVMVQLV
jgi:hypothetical protein